MNKRYVAVERFYRSKILAQMTILITFFFQMKPTSSYCLSRECNHFILLKHATNLAYVIKTEGCYRYVLTKYRIL